MNYRPFGRTGLRIAPLALGTWNFADPTPPADCIRIVHRALDAGINLLDSADLYAHGEAERILGQALANGKRQHVILATKGHYPTSKGPRFES